MNPEDQKLLSTLRRLADETGYSPEWILEAGAEGARFNKMATIPAMPPYPSSVEEVQIFGVHPSEWPEWASLLLPPGSRLERLHYSDNTHVIRLVTSSARVLAARRLEPDPTLPAHLP